MSRCVLSLCLWLFLTLALLAGHGATAALAFGEGAGEEAPVDLSAAHLSYDQASRTYTASGDVQLRKGAVTLLADSVLFRTETEEAEAVGNIQLTDPEAEVEAERIFLDLKSGQGRMVKGRILLREEQYRIAGDLIDRLGEHDYRIEKGTFTTCEGPVPSWKFGADRIDVTVGGYARGRHAFFYIHDIPVLYFPYFFYPVKTERESGFLTPGFGSSSRRGTQFSLPWYQVIAPNQDATLQLDYYSKLGLGKGLEYRYIFGADNAGELNLYHVGGASDERDRYSVLWTHDGRLPGDVRLTADVEWVSSRDYFDIFGREAETYNQDRTESVVALSRRWRDYTLGGQFKYTQDLNAESSAETLQRLPEVVFSAVPRPLGGTPFFFGLQSTVDNFWRREGLKGQRLTLRPELSAAFRPGDLLEIRPVIGYRERLYETGSSGSGSEHEGMFDFSTRISTRFARVYEVGGQRVSRIQHTLQPEILYTYTPREDQDHLPQFDLLDRLEPENRIGYALVNRFTARLEDEGGPTYHEFLYLRLSQSYDIRESRRDRLAPGERREPFSDLRAELIARPNAWSYLNLDVRFDVESREDFWDRFFMLKVGGGVQDGNGNGLSFSYRYHDDFVHYGSVGVDIAWLKPVYLNYQHRYDFESRRTLSQVLNLEYRAQCWSLFLTVRDRLEDTEFLVSFGLVGLGKVGRP